MNMGSKGETGNNADRGILVANQDIITISTLASRKNAGDLTRKNISLDSIISLEIDGL